MQRRDLLKALATVPLAAALAGCERERHKEDESHILEVHLDGAFAVVIQENKANSILAFSPRPKVGDEPHQFYFNGYPKAEDPKKSYQFKLSAETRDRDSKIEISRGLNDFSFNTENWRVGDSLLTIELPAPDRITFSGHRSPVRFLSDNRLAFMPTNHILEYDLKNKSQQKLECSESSLKCEASPDSFPGVTRYFFEIGPKRSLDAIQSREHAIGFFNYILQQSFRDLAEKYQLDPKYARGMESTEGTPRVAPAVFQYDFSNPLRQNASYAVDCEFAGPQVSTRTAPSKP